MVIEDRLALEDRGRKLLLNRPLQLTGGRRRRATCAITGAARSWTASVRLTEMSVEGETDG